MTNQTKNFHKCDLSSPEIIYEDEDFFVVYKPEGWVVYKQGKVLKTKSYLSDFFEYKFKNESWEDPERKGFANRIDEDTSGILMAAKNQKTLFEIQQIIKDRNIEKWYIAFINGNIENKGIIDAPLQRIPNSTKQRVSVNDKSKNSISLFYKIGYLADIDQSLVFIYLYTGRTHQIRAHFSSIGKNIIGDKIYGKRANTKHLYLLSYYYNFYFKKDHEIYSPVPDFMRSKLESFNLSSEEIKKKLSGCREDLEKNKKSLGLV